MATKVNVLRGIPATMFKESNGAPSRVTLAPGEYTVLGRSPDGKYSSLKRGQDSWTVLSEQLRTSVVTPTKTDKALPPRVSTPLTALGEARRALRRVASAKTLAEAQRYVLSFFGEAAPKDEPDPDEQPAGESDPGFDFGSDEPAPEAPPAGEEPPIDLGGPIDAAPPAGAPTVIAKADWEKKQSAGQAAYMGDTPFIVLQDETTDITALVPVEIGAASDPAVKAAKSSKGDEKSEKSDD